MSTSTNTQFAGDNNWSYWNFEHLAKLYYLSSITKVLIKPDYDPESDFTVGNARLEFDFGAPDMFYRGERKMDYFMRMVSAGPEMLKALEIAKELICEIRNAGCLYSDYHKTMLVADVEPYLNIVSNAIAKAKGEAP